MLMKKQKKMWLKAAKHDDGNGDEADAEADSDEVRRVLLLGGHMMFRKRNRDLCSRSLPCIGGWKLTVDAYWLWCSCINVVRRKRKRKTPSSRGSTGTSGASSSNSARTTRCARIDAPKYLENIREAVTCLMPFENPAPVVPPSLTHHSTTPRGTGISLVSLVRLVFVCPHVVRFLSAMCAVCA